MMIITIMIMISTIQHVVVPCQNILGTFLLFTIEIYQAYLFLAEEPYYRYQLFLESNFDIIIDIVTL